MLQLVSVSVQRDIVPLYTRLAINTCALSSSLLRCLSSNVCPPRLLTLPNMLPAGKDERKASHSLEEVLAVLRALGVGEAQERASDDVLLDADAVEMRRSRRGGTGPYDARGAVATTRRDDDAMGVEVEEAAATFWAQVAHRVCSGVVRRETVVTGRLEPAAKGWLAGRVVYMLVFVFWWVVGARLGCIGWYWLVVV